MFSRFQHALGLRASAVALALSSCLASALALELGTRSLLVADAAPMTSITLAPSRSSFTRFAIKVGGVAFTTTASSTDGSRILGIRYLPAAADGERLVLELAGADGAKVVAPLPAKDWMALPLARFVDTGDHGAVTLFGALKDEALEQQYRQDRKAMIANYHPELLDTLLGLRLLQADMVLIEEQADDIFKDAGHYLLGAGESAPTASSLKANAARRATATAWQEAQPKSFESYVVGDINAQVTFALRKGQLKLAGDPTWACWHRDHKAVLDTINKLSAKSSADAYLAYITNSFKRATAAADLTVPPASAAPEPGALMQRAFEVRWVAIEGIAREVLKRTGSGRPQPTSFSPAELKAALTANDRNAVGKIIAQASEKLDELSSTSSAGKDLEAQLTELVPRITKAIEALDVVQMTAYSAGLSNLMKEQKGINPIVYDALTGAVRLAAVLRAAKQADPGGYAAMIAAIKDRRSNGVLSPSGYKLRTPTVYPRE